MIQCALTLLAEKKIWQIDYLGGDPTMKGKELEYSQDSKMMLQIDLRPHADYCTM
jgi:hypothetical protein